MELRWPAMLVAALLLGVTATATGQPEPPGAGMSLPEWWTAGSIKMALLAHPVVSGTEVADIEVTVRRRAATLRGRVASQAARQAARTIAAAVAGVDAVQDELRVTPAHTAPDPVPSDSTLARTVRRLLRSRPGLADVRVTVDQRVARLQGPVPAFWDRVRASEIPRSVVGVRAVRNDTWPTRLALAAPRPR